jgi:AraC-like DNA-binding protein
MYAQHSAEEVGMSRSGFSASFTNLVGESVIRYLTYWHMQLARAQLQETSDPLSILAGPLATNLRGHFAAHSNGYLVNRLEASAKLSKLTSSHRELLYSLKFSVYYWFSQKSVTDP